MLDEAARSLRVGMTTEEIDRIIHEVNLVLYSIIKISDSYFSVVWTMNVIHHHSTITNSRNHVARAFVIHSRYYGSPMTL